MISIDRVSFSYGDKQILRDYSLNVEKGERICLSAPSGSGKTTLFRLIAGLERPDSGTIRLDGRVNYLFQEDRLLPWLTVVENLTLLGVGKRRAEELLSTVGLEEFDKYPAELSGGMKRRVAIARSICAGGEILLLDEPFTGLDAGLREVCAGALKNEFASATILMITHDRREAELFDAKIVNFVPDERANESKNEIIGEKSRSG